MKSTMYDNCEILTNGKAEKLAALLVLSKLSDKPVSDAVFKDALAGRGCETYPYVHCHGSTVSGRTKPLGTSVVIPFEDIEDIEKIVCPRTSVKLNSEHTAEIHANGTVKVGCQTFDIQVIKEIVSAFEGLKKP